MSGNNLIIRGLAYTLWALILIVPLADFLSVYARSIGLESLERFSLLYRFLMIGISAILMFTYNNLYRREVLFVLLYGFGSISVNFFIVDGVDVELFLETLLLLFKFFTFFIFLWAISTTLRNGIVSYGFFEYSFTILILIYAGCIAIGAIFGIELFENYTNERWGVKGIIISGNEASGFLLIALCWSLLMRGKYLFYPLIATVMLASLLSGTKSAILGVILLLTGYFYSRYRLKGFYISLASCLSILLIFNFAYSEIPAFRDNFDQNLAYFMWQWDNMASGSLVTMALTGRDYKLGVVLADLFQFSWWSVLTGGYPLGNYYVEMDLFDLLFLLGLIAGYFYFYLWLKMWGSFSDIHLGMFKLSFCVIYFLLGTLGGHFYYSAMAAPFLAALCVVFNRETYCAKRN